MPKEPLVKIIPRPKPKTPLWINFFFWLSLILLVSSVASFFLLQNQTSVLKANKEKIETQIGVVGTQAQKLLEEEILDISEKIRDFSTLFKEHKITSKIFDFLEASCHPKVQFTALDLETKNYTVTLRGRTENFQTLGEQLLILESNKDIKNLELSDISFGREGKVGFGLTFNLTEELFRR